MSVSVFDLFAKIKLDSSEYDKGLDDAERRSGDVGSKIGSGLAAAGKAAGVAIGAAATAVAGLTIQAKNAYAEQEQLVGGVETLFGKASKSVIENAKQAFSTAGMSANAYMETVTSFSASLIQSLGGDTKKAAEYADMALVDMSDNANKMGTNMESIQAAYQGFAKQNYNMLDNLKLGYGGTQKEMFRLLQDAAKLDKKFAETAQFSLDEKGHLEAGYADIVQAIHIVQDQMGISNTTIEEASKTISGSAGQVRAAWENLVAGFADKNADLGALINNVVVSAETAFKNMMPAIEQALGGIGSFIEQMVPIISEKLPEAVGQILPSLLKAATSLVQGVVTALPELITVLVEQVPTVLQQLATAVIETAPTLIESVHELFDMVVEGINEAIPILLEKAPQIISDLINGINTALPLVVEAATSIIGTLAQGIAQNLPTMIQEGLNALVEFSGTLKEGAGDLIDAGLDLIMALADGIIDSIPTLIETVPTIIDNLANIINENAPKLLKSGLELIVKLGKGLIDAIPTLIANIPKIIMALVDVWNAFNWAQLGIKLVKFIASGIQSLAGQIPNAVKGIAEKAGTFFKNVNWAEVGSHAIKTIVNGLKNLGNTVMTTLKTIGTDAFKAFKDINWIELGGNIVNGLISGVAGLGKSFIDAIVNLAKGAFDAIKNFFGIHSPSKKMRDEIGKNIVKGLIQGVDDEKGNAKKSAEELSALYVSAAKKKVEALKAQNKLSLDDELYYWQTVRDHIKKGTTAWDEATVQIGKVQERITKSYMQEAEKRYKALKANNKLSLTEEVAYWEDVRDHYKKGTDEYLKATEKIGKAKQNIKKEVESAEKEYQSGVEKIVKDLDDTITKLEKTYNDAVEKRYGDIMKSFGLFGEAKLDEGIGSQTLLNNLESQVKALDQWQEALIGLQNRLGDKSPDLYEELENMGVSSLETLKNLNSMTDTELNRYIELYGKKQEIAKAESEREHEELLAETQRQVEEAEKDAADKIATLTTSYEGKLKALGVSIKKKSLENGEQIPKGMWKGIKSQWGDLETKTMDRVNSLVAKIQSALQIASPSKVFANEIGKWLPLGIEKGFTDAMPQAERGILDSIDDMKANVASNLDMTGITTPMEFNSSTDSSPLANILYGIYDLLSGMPEDMKAAMDNTAISINNREFARLVKAV